MNDVLTAVEIARRLADVLERHSIRYAIGGALALAYYAPPRATVDVDINVFVPPRDGLDRLLEVLVDRCSVGRSTSWVRKTCSR